MQSDGLYRRGLGLNFREPYIAGCCGVSVGTYLEVDSLHAAGTVLWNRCRLFLCNRGVGKLRPLPIVQLFRLVWECFVRQCGSAQRVSAPVKTICGSVSAGSYIVCFARHTGTVRLGYAVCCHVAVDWCNFVRCADTAHCLSK